MTNEQIQHGMSVVSADGVVLGKVDDVGPDTIKLQREGSSDGHHHHIPVSAVSSVDDRVHLSLDAAAAHALFAERVAPVAGAAVAAERTGLGWLPWLLGALVLLGLLIFGLRGCDNDDRAAAPADTTVAVAAPTTSSLGRDVETYLGTTDPTPHSFPFSNVHFDTGSATIRDSDRAELNDLAAVLKSHGSARADVIGFADAAGNDAANTKLSADRAKAVTDALVSQGVARSALKPRGEGEANVAGADQAARVVQLVITGR